MVANTEARKFRLKCIRAYKVGENIVQPGAIIETTQEEAKSLLALGVQGQYDFSGEVNHIATPPTLKFFELVRQESEEDKLLKQLQS